MKTTLLATLFFPGTAVLALSSSSSFLGRQSLKTLLPSPAFVHKKTLVMYDSSGDPPALPEHNAWSVLANTERWLSSTLASFETSAPSKNAGGATKSNNPYARKEVSYACETAKDSALVVASIFRRLKDARELGEQHGKEEERRLREIDGYELRTHRQTQVVVIPGSKALTESFIVFNKMVETINQARRKARDYVTDVALEKVDDALTAADGNDDDENVIRDWSVSVNLAHLHPKYGEKTSEQILQDMKEEEAAGEVDVHYQEFKEKRLLARRSPYPTVVIEVRSIPPPDFGSSGTKSKPVAAAKVDKVSSSDVQRLEALFGKTAHFNHPTRDQSPEQGEDDFYSSIGKNIKELSSVTPLRLAQQWLVENDSNLPQGAAVLTQSDAAQVDAAYEYIFTNIAMMMESNEQTHASRRQYIVMPHFLSSSAISFEKFATEVEKLTAVLPELTQKIKVSTFHPEHIDHSKRSPVPVYVLERISATDIQNFENSVFE